jgi:hypothetical protein
VCGARGGSHLVPNEAADPLMPPGAPAFASWRQSAVGSAIAACSC